jgi:transglutaminase-like putative cysteine protease
MRGLLTSLFTLGVIAPIAVGQQPLLDTWDAAYLQGSRAGYIHTRTDEIDHDGAKLWRTTMELRLTVKRFNDSVQLGMDTGTFETPEGKVTGVFMRQYLGKAKKLDIQGTVVGKQLKLVLDGAKPLEPAPWNDRVIGLFRQQTLFKDRQVKPGGKFTYLSFEPSINIVLPTHVDVKDYEEVELFAGSQKQKLLRVESKPERIEKVQLPALTTWLNGNLEQVRAEVEVPGLGAIQLYRTTKAVALSPSDRAVQTDIGLSQLVRLSQRILQPYDTRAAHYRIRIRDDDDASSTFEQDDRQQVKNVNGDRFELYVRASGAPKAQAAAAKPGAEYLQSCYFINSDDARVRQLTREAVGAEQDSWQKALHIERWVHDHMQSRNHEALATADHVARTLEGDCTEYAMLTAAMCRAVGVPSRTAVGLIYADVKGSPTFAFHMWTEVWARGQWVPLDATLGRGYVGATHLKISSHSWHDTRTMTPLFPVVRVLGRISIDVLGVEPR